MLLRMKMVPVSINTCVKFLVKGAMNLLAHQSLKVEKNDVFYNDGVIKKFQNDLNTFETFIYQAWV